MFLIEPDPVPTSSFQILTSASQDVEQYQERQEIEHILASPDMFIDSSVHLPRMEYLYINGKIEQHNISMPMCIFRLFMEAFANAVDASSKSARKGVDPGKIVVTMDSKRVSIYNEGLPIPLEEHPSNGLLVPEMLFGRLRTSSNYTGVRYEIGRNGYGAKLVNIYSLLFIAESYCGITRRYWKGTWTNNMSVMTDREFVSKDLGPTSFVRVTYELDFKRFGYLEYPPEAIYLFSRSCVDACFTNKVNVTFNDQVFNFSSAKAYASLYFPSECQTLTYYKWPPGIAPFVDSDGTESPPNKFTLPDIELIAIDTPNASKNISFVNSMMTMDGGIHVENSIKKLSDYIVSVVNAKYKAKSKTKNAKVGDKEKEKDKSPKVNLSHVRPNLSVIVAVRVQNPSFASQTKTLFRGVEGPNPDVPIPITDKIMDGMKNWNLYRILTALMEAKNYQELSKTDGKKIRHLYDKKILDANFAGTSRSDEATCIFTEGKSAKQLVVVLRGCIPRGQDVLGAVPLRGKMINALNHTPLEMSDNEEVKLIKKALGLKEGIDYTIPGNRTTLRYGRAMIMADQDVDGRHIKGLFLIYMEAYFPSLLQCGFVMEYMTPSIRGTKGGDEMKFYNDYEYELWTKSMTNMMGWKIKRCKGLASSSKEEIKNDIKNPRILVIQRDELATQSLHLGFNGERLFSNLRKKWIDTFDRSSVPEPINGAQTVTSYIKDELITFAIANLERHIPSIYDGLKDCQRKIIYTYMGPKGVFDINKLVGVGPFSGKVINKAEYQHGETSLHDAVALMCADYAGSNNMPYFKSESMLGSRMEGSADAGAARYTKFKGQPWLELVYNKKDLALLKPVTGEGEKKDGTRKQIGYEYYFTPVPMHMINGARGIASGHATFIPNFHPIAIINGLRELIAGLPLTPLVPYYKGHTGPITISDKRKMKYETSSVPINFTLSDEDMVPVTKPGKDEEPEWTLYNPKIPGSLNGTYLSGGKYVMVSRGYFVDDGRHTISIKELPIGVWTVTYKEFIRQLLKDKKITDMKDYCDDEKVHIDIMDFKGRKSGDNMMVTDDLSLHLIRRYSLNNMILLDENKKPRKFGSPEDILKYFFNLTLDGYHRRKMHIIDTLTRQILDISGKIRFMEAVMSGYLNLWSSGKSRPVEDIYHEMDSLEIERKHLSTTCKSFTVEKLLSLHEKRAKLVQEREQISVVPPTDLWLEDLARLEKYCLTIFKDPPPKGGIRIGPPEPKQQILPPQAFTFDTPHYHHIPDLPQPISFAVIS